MSKVWLNENGTQDDIKNSTPILSAGMEWYLFAIFISILKSCGWKFDLEAHDNGLKCCQLSLPEKAVA